MTPIQQCTIGGRLIQEFYWAGKSVVYVDHHLFHGTYSEAVATASDFEALRAACNPQPRSG